MLDLLEQFQQTTQLPLLLMMMMYANRSGCMMCRLHISCAAAATLAHPMLDRELLPVSFFQADGPACACTDIR
jgi:hypothetical protein